MNWFINVVGWNKWFKCWGVLEPVDTTFSCVMSKPTKRHMLYSKTVTVEVPIPMEAWLDLAADYIVRKLTA